MLFLVRDFGVYAFEVIAFFPDADLFPLFFLDAGMREVCGITSFGNLFFISDGVVCGLWGKRFLLIEGQIALEVEVGPQIGEISILRASNASEND